MSALTAALRQLWGNPNPFGVRGTFPTDHPVLLSLIWCLGLLAVFSVLAVGKYRSMSR